MALSRFARSNLKQSGRAISNYMTETGILSEGVSTSRRYFSSVSNITGSSNLKYLSGIGNIYILVFGSRGIRITPKYQFPSPENILEDLDSEDYYEKLPGLEATNPGEKPRVVVLGTGWAACRFLKGLDTKIYDAVCISPRNHMVFTPLLASTCVGTLEFRSVSEPVSRIQSALATCPNSYFYLASCIGINTDKHEVHCETAGSVGLPHEPYRFKVAYDKLVIATGADPLTFNIKGVKEHAFFLREVNHAQEIRRKLLLNLMLSENPG
nr:TPA_asm: hypothetical protein HUJ06_024474 [Nelumbo nucifera]